MGYKSDMSSDVSIKRMHAVFSGQVQGVGFRFMVCHVAEKFSILGLVRNFGNGDVEVIAEGAEQILVNFLHGIHGSSVGRNITNERINWQPATREFNAFGVSF